MSTILEFIDINGMVKTRREQRDTGNGILYTAIALILNFEEIDKVQLGCAPFYKKGVLMRTPENTYGQEGWDDYLGFCAATIFCGYAAKSREIYAHYWSHLGFFANQPLTYKAWLARHVQLWWLVFAASFPKLKELVHFQLWICQKFMRGGKQGGGGLMLEWCFMVSYRKLYGPNKKWFDWCKNTDMVAAIKDQCDHDHPFVEWMKRYQDEYGTS